MKWIRQSRAKMQVVKVWGKLGRQFFPQCPNIPSHLVCPFICPFCLGRDMDMSPEKFCMSPGTYVLWFAKGREGYGKIFCPSTQGSRGTCPFLSSLDLPLGRDMSVLSSLHSPLGRDMPNLLSLHRVFERDMHFNSLHCLSDYLHCTK